MTTQAPPRPPLEDPDHERELIVSEVPYLSVVDGNVVVTLATPCSEQTLTLVGAQVTGPFESRITEGRGGTRRGDRWHAKEGASTHSRS
jgi:hypothetical protein